MLMAAGFRLLLAAGARFPRAAPELGAADGGVVYYEARWNRERAVVEPETRRDGTGNKARWN